VEDDKPYDKKLVTQNLIMSSMQTGETDRKSSLTDKVPPSISAHGFSDGVNKTVISKTVHLLARRVSHLLQGAFRHRGDFQMRGEFEMLLQMELSFRREFN